MEMVTETDLTMEQAMSMLMTGGAVCPEVIRYSRSASSHENRAGSPVGVTYAVEDESKIVALDGVVGDGTPASLDPVPQI